MAETVQKDEKFTPYKLMERIKKKENVVKLPQKNKPTQEEQIEALKQKIEKGKETVRKDEERLRKKILKANEDKMNLKISDETAMRLLEAGIMDVEAILKELLDDHEAEHK